MTTTTARRPFGVGFLSILLIISGIFDVVAGIVLIAVNVDDTLRQELREVTEGSVTTYAIVTIAFGVIAILTGVGLRNGANWARGLVAGVAVGRLVVLVWAVIAYHGLHWYQAILPTALYVMIAAYLLGDEDTKRYFSR